MSLIMSRPLIEVRGLTRHFDSSASAFGGLLVGGFLGWHKAVVRAVEGVDFQITRGETFALVGESGCGKSTLARCVVGLLAPTAGSVAFSGRRVQMIFQNPYASLNPRWRIFDIIAEPVRAYRLVDAVNIDRRVKELLDMVGLSVADARKYPHQFSGGQRQRISIARALAGEPDLLVCDEPTSSLDVSVQAQILNLLKDVQRELKLSYLFISHNLPVVYQMADRVGVMYLGKIVEMATTDRLFAAPQHPYTRMLLAAVPQLDGVRISGDVPVGDLPSPIEPPPGCRFHPRCPLAFERCRSEEPQMIDGVACHAVRVAQPA
jgi:peptide/nickel transport system ATP-binding protein